MSDELGSGFDLEGYEDQTEGEEQEAGTGDEGEFAPEGTNDDTGAESEAEAKRINDLMSKWQKAEARIKEMETQLQEAQQSKGDGSNVEQYLELMRAQARDQVYASDPRFGEYDLDRSWIEGSTPDEMKQSAKRLSDLLDRVASGAESKALKKHGLSPEIKGSSAPKMPDIEAMSDEDFIKWRDKQLAKVR